VAAFLKEAGRLVIGEGEMWQRMMAENPNPGSPKVKELEGRLCRIFDVPESDHRLVDGMCRSFLKPTFARARVYDDVFITLNRLRADGVRMAIVSNTPWGSPAHIWREELDRLRITRLVEAGFFCRDVGWRKPDRRIFDHVTAALGVAPADCLFVGDDPRWDIVGPRAIGMPAALIDRAGVSDARGVPVVRNLWQLVRMVGSVGGRGR
jgi:HAD superfamily hydrolase (TIGR01509 family)